MSPEAEAALDALCDQLARATMARKVLLCASDGGILAHVGESGLFTNDRGVGTALARLVADLLVEAQLREADLFPHEDPEDHFTQVGRLRVCATPLATRALLLVLFDDSVEAGLVRVRVRRARRLLLRVLGEQDPNL